VKAPVALPSGAVLRPLTEADAPLLLDAYLRNRAHLAPFEPDRPDSFYTLQGQRTRLEGLVRRRREGAGLPCAMFAGDRILGCAALRDIVRGPVCEAHLGYWVDAGSTRRGLAGAAVAALCRIADEELGLHRIVAGTAPGNVASQGVLKRNGFQQFGYAHKHLYLGGRWTDAALFEKILNDRPPPPPE
jgi:[ribosomal protein S5]-alanine N-acetyltransferase